MSAVGQNLSSIGIAFGLVISFASYNRYDNNILVDTMTISLINGVSSFAVGLFTFATLGSMAKEYDTSVEDVIPDGKSNTRFSGKIMHLNSVRKCFIYFDKRFVNANAPIEITVKNLDCRVHK